MSLDDDNNIEAASRTTNIDWRSLTTPQTVIATTVLTTGILFSIRLYKTRLRRIPNVDYLKPQHFTDLSSYATPTPSRASTKSSTSASSSSIQRTLQPTPHLPIRTSLLGTCTSTNDPDNFRLYHTPLGRLAFWRAATPTSRKDLKDQTIHIRIAGIDAPELAHFGKPAQPYADKALIALRKIVEGKRVRVWVLRRDQYNRVVGLAFVGRGFGSWAEGVREEGWTSFWRRDIGFEMLKLGCASVYEGSFGAEYGGWEREGRYRDAEGEARKKGLGMWAASKTKGEKSQEAKGIWGAMAGWIGLGGGQEMDATGGKSVAFESPREYKQRMTRLEEEHAAAAIRKKKEKN